MFSRFRKAPEGSTPNKPATLPTYKAESVVGDVVHLTADMLNHLRAEELKRQQTQKHA